MPDDDPFESLKPPEDVFAKPSLDIRLLKNLEVGNIFHDHKYVLSIGWDDESLNVIEVTDNLKHEVKTPDSVHADGHEDHEAKRNDQRKDHGVRGTASDLVDCVELVLRLHLRRD